MAEQITNLVRGYVTDTRVKARDRGSLHGINISGLT